MENKIQILCVFVKIRLKILLHRLRLLVG